MPESTRRPSRLHRLIHHRWWGGLRIDYGVVRWRCCGEIYGYVPEFKEPRDSTDE